MEMKTAHGVPALMVAAMLTAAASSFAEEGSDVAGQSADQQGDENINVWVDNAPLDLFITQLASITGRKAIIEGDVGDQNVSGEFTGTMTDTLSAVSEQLDVVFELDELIIGVVPASDSTTARLLAPGHARQLGAELLDELQADILPGNKIATANDEIVVSGHPEFVQRVADRLKSAIADVSKLSGESVVADAATKIMVDTERDQPEVPADVDTALTAPEPVRWVTDIPGFDTF